MEITQSKAPHPHYIPGIDVTLRRSELAALVLHGIAIVERVVETPVEEEGKEPTVEHKHQLIRVVISSDPV